MQEQLYKNYNARELEYQYSPSQSVQGAEHIIAGWQQESIKYRAQQTNMASYNLAYGKSDGEKLDIFFSTQSHGPVQIFLHGGYWQQTEKKDYSFLARELVDSGVVMVIPDYNLCPRVGVSDIIEEIRRSVIWVYHNIHRFGGDPERIYLSGHSAGGHLAAMMAFTQWKTLGAKLPVDLIKGAISISGVFDLEPLVYTSINHALGLTKNTARQLSPLFLSAENVPPMSFVVGDEESDEFKRQSDAMHSHWQEMTAISHRLNLPARNHFNIINDVSNNSTRLFAEFKNQAFV